MGFILASCIVVPISQNPPITPVPTKQGKQPTGIPTVPKQNSLFYYGFIPFSEEVSPDLEIGEDINFRFVGKLQKAGITIKVFEEQQPINFQMAESPEVTIEPVGEDAVKQQLQTLLTTENLGGIIFGHIMQDLVKDTVYVIARVYLVNNPGQYQTFGHEDAMGIKVADVKPEIIRERVAQIAQQIRGMKVQQPQTSSPPGATPPQNPPQKNDVIENLGGSVS